MFSYTALRNHFGKLSLDNSSANLTLGDTLINSFYRRILRKGNWPFLERTGSITTVASTQFYDLFFNYRKLLDSPYLTVSSTQYPMTEVTTRAQWNILNQTTTTTSNQPTHYYIFNGEIGIYPTSASAGNTLTVPYLIRVKDLSVADYTTGTIVTAPNGDETITGSGTTWTSQMAGRWMRITDADAAGSGDGVWYEIDSVTSTTVLELVEKYNGTSIATGSAAYTIGQMSVLPEEFHETPVYGALWVYFTSVKPEPTRAQLYKELYTDDIRDLLKDQGSKTTSPATDSEIYDLLNPNLYVSL